MNEYEKNSYLMKLSKPLNVDLTVEEKAIERDDLVLKVETLEGLKDSVESEKNEFANELDELKQRLSDYMEWARLEVVPQIENDELTNTKVYDELISELKKALRG